MLITPCQVCHDNQHRRGNHTNDCNGDEHGFRQATQSAGGINDKTIPSTVIAMDLSRPAIPSPQIFQPTHRPCIVFLDKRG